MSEIICIFSLCVLALSFLVLWGAGISIQKSKAILSFVYDMLENLERSRSKCCCHDEPDNEVG